MREISQLQTLYKLTLQIFIWQYLQIEKEKKKKSTPQQNPQPFPHKILGASLFMCFKLGKNELV